MFAGIFVSLRLNLGFKDLTGLARCHMGFDKYLDLCYRQICQMLLNVNHWMLHHPGLLPIYL